MKLSIQAIAAFVLLVLFASSAHAADMSGVVDTILGKYQNAGQAWLGTIKNAATSLFWILATISLSWTCISMAIKRAEMGEFFAELCRFIMFSGLFFWLLTNGAEFANDIITSLRQVGGDAAGTGKSIYPGDLIELAMQVFQNTMKHINFLAPESLVVPVIISLLILIVCALIAVNMILLLCAAWVVVYAGIIFLGFGGCRWTSDMAINYYRTVLGVGVSLMTMQLIIGIGVKCLQDLVTSTGQMLDAPTLAVIMVACIILAVIAHRLPQMVAGMVVGGGHNGAIGGVGIMTLLGTGVALTSMAGSAAAAASTAGGSAAAAESHKLLMDRIAAAEAAMAAGSGGNGNNVSTNTTRPDTNASAAGLTGPGRNPGTDTGASRRPTSAPNTSPGTSSAAGKKTSTGPAPAGSPEVDEPPLARPMTPDEQRGFPPPADPPEWQK
jgi:type IV secretion system protein VirB6/type IV secretion system protein TrbL